jgi:hypothetical protein
MLLQEVGASLRRIHTPWRLAGFETSPGNEGTAPLVWG